MITGAHAAGHSRTMTRSLALVAAALVACSQSNTSSTGAGGAASSSTSTGGPSSTGSTSTSSSGNSSSGATTSSSSGAGGAGPACSVPLAPMTLISRNAPAFASDGANASASDDDSPAQAWSSAGTPTWLAYDLSAVPASQRHQVLLSWYAIHAGCYIDTSMPTQGQRPIDYSIEINTAPSAASPPSTGWTEVLSVQQNRYCGRSHVVDLQGAGWVRMKVAQGSADSPSVSFDLDVQDASAGACDSWLFMGDSITYMTMTHAFCDLPTLVRDGKAAYWPAVLDAAIGGTSTASAIGVIDDTIKDFPGHFVVLAYGTNDHANDFHMEELVQHVLAAGKIPVVPHMPWSDHATDGPAINQAIDALYAKYPAIVRGPDLWAFFNGRNDLIPPGDVHPNQAGQEELRKQWAATMQSLDH